MKYLPVKIKKKFKGYKENKMKNLFECYNYSSNMSLKEMTENILKINKGLWDDLIQ